MLLPSDYHQKWQPGGYGLPVISSYTDDIEDKKDEPEPVEDKTADELLPGSLK